MKLFNAIAAAAVIGASIFAVAPEAKADYWFNYLMNHNNQKLDQLIQHGYEDPYRTRTNCTVRNTYGDNYSVDCW